MQEIEDLKHKKAIEIALRRMKSFEKGEEERHERQSRIKRELQELTESMQTPVKERQIVGLTTPQVGGEQ